MGAEGAVDATAFDAEDDAEVDGDPFCLDAGAAVGAPAVALVIVADDLEEFGGVALKAAAVAADVRWAGADGGAPVHVVGGGARGVGRGVVLMVVVAR